MVKLSLGMILPVLLYIYNCSLRLGIFLNVLKQALICPIFKITNPSALTVFRPISILITLAKPLQKEVDHLLTNYLDKHSLLDLF